MESCNDSDRGLLKNWKQNLCTCRCILLGHWYLKGLGWVEGWYPPFLMGNLVELSTDSVE